MKKIFFALGLVVAGISLANAQQVPLYSQYYYNPFIYNPARTGDGENAEAFFIYRKQWVDFEGAPETRAVTFDAPLADRKIGLGLYVFSDITDVFRRNGAYGAYAYHLKLNENSRLSLGLTAGVQDMRIDFERVFVIDPSDVAIANNVQNGATFDASVGLNYNWKRLNIGLSVPQLLETELKYVNDGQPTLFTLRRHYLIAADYNYGLSNDKFFINPHVMFRTPNFNNFQVDGGVTFKYRDIVWLDGTYRYNYGVTIGAGVKVHKTISIGYSYDLGLNDLATYAGGTHEVLLGITFGSRKDRSSEYGDEVIQELMDKEAEQDSAIAAMGAEIDSLQQTVDSLALLLEQGFEVEMDMEELDSLRARLSELERQLDGKLNTLQEEVERTKQAQEEMAEERTRIVDEKDLEYKQGARLGDYFMVVGSFRIEENSYNFENTLAGRGYNAGVVYDKKRKWYYVYIAQPNDLEKGLEELYKLRETNKEFEDAWIHIMSKSVR